MLFRAKGPSIGIVLDENPEMSEEATSDQLKAAGDFCDVKSVVRLMRMHRGSRRLQGQGCKTLACLVDDSIIREQVADAGGTEEAIIAMMSHGSDAIVQVRTFTRTHTHGLSLFACLFFLLFLQMNKPGQSFAG